MSNICVYGSSSAAIDRGFLDDAYHLGEVLAENGYGLVFGAGAMGIMGAAARGARSKGGAVTGVLPSFMNVEGIPYAGCDKLIVTETMRERKQAMEELADAFITAPGGIGTFEEFFEILTLKQLRRHKKAIVLLNADGYYDNLRAMMEESVRRSFAKAPTLELYAVADTPEEAVEYIRNYEFKDFPDKWFT
jgi:uncharacterized protein (TIGR00730 family)